MSSPTLVLSRAASFHAVDYSLPLPAPMHQDSRVSVSPTLTESSRGMPLWRRTRRHLRTDIDPVAALPHLSVYAFHTGLVNAITFSALSVWAGFQSANTVQLGIGLARLIDSPSQGLHMIDRQAAASLGAFVFGALLARPFAAYARARWWLFLSTAVQALLLGGATLAIVRSAHPDHPRLERLVSDVNWTDAAGFVGLCLAAASVGLQGATASRLKTPFGPAVPLTSTWVDLAIEPALFAWKVVYTREARSSCILATFVGGFAGRALVQSVGSRATLGIAALFKIVMALLWLWTRSAEEKDSEK